MRKFNMIRNADESGVSGTGCVLEGVEFTCGKVVVCWLTTVSSVCSYDSFADFMAIHVDSHPTNGTEIVWSQ